MTKSFKIANAWQIKLVLTFLMLLDHLRFIYHFISPELAQLFNVISRGVAPMFAYLCVEGIVYSSNRRKYCLRIGVVAAVMFITNYIFRRIFETFFPIYIEEYNGYLFQTNIFATLFLAVTGTLLVKSFLESKKFLHLIVSIILLFVGFWFCEWGSVVVPIMLIFYFAKTTKLKAILIALLFLFTLLINSEPLFLEFLIFLAIYNGKRGRNTRTSKYFFYLFYPLHLWAISLVNIIILSSL